MCRLGWWLRPLPAPDHPWYELAKLTRGFPRARLLVHRHRVRSRTYKQTTVLSGMFHVLAAELAAPAAFAYFAFWVEVLR